MQYARHIPKLSKNTPLFGGSSLTPATSCVPNNIQVPS
jgi:hypothetical protein